MQFKVPTPTTLWPPNQTPERLHFIYSSHLFVLTTATEDHLPLGQPCLASSPLDPDPRATRLVSQVQSDPSPSYYSLSSSSAAKWRSCLVAVGLTETCSSRVKIMMGVKSSKLSIDADHDNRRRRQPQTTTTRCLLNSPIILCANLITI